MSLFSSSPRFVLPDQGIFLANSPDDPLPYYYKPLLGLLYRARVEQTLALLHPPYGSILEIGYGSGLLLPSLCGLGTNVSGVDLSSDPEQVSCSLKKVGVHCELVQGDVVEDLFAKESFDLIVAISILEHIRELSPVFERLHALLKPSGQLLVGMPRVDKFMSKAFSLIGFANINDHHLTDYESCKQVAAEYFTLTSERCLPSCAPPFLGIYFSMFFQKKDD